jgi:hypothetical protein
VGPPLTVSFPDAVEDVVDDEDDDGELLQALSVRAVTATVAHRVAVARRRRRPGRGV